MTAPRMTPSMPKPTAGLGDVEHVRSQIREDVVLFADVLAKEVNLPPHHVWFRSGPLGLEYELTRFFGCEICSTSVAVHVRAGLVPHEVGRMEELSIQVNYQRPAVRVAADEFTRSRACVGSDMFGASVTIVVRSKDDPKRFKSLRLKRQPMSWEAPSAEALAAEVAANIKATLTAYRKARRSGLMGTGKPRAA